MGFYIEKNLSCDVVVAIFYAPYLLKSLTLWIPNIYLFLNANCHFFTFFCWTSLVVLVRQNGEVQNIRCLVIGRHVGLRKHIKICHLLKRLSIYTWWTCILNCRMLVKDEYNCRLALDTIIIKTSANVLRSFLAINYINNFKCTQLSVEISDRTGFTFDSWSHRILRRYCRKMAAL